MSAPLRVDPGDWDRWIPPPDHAQLVLGGPGTGKSEFLVRRAAHLMGGERGRGALVLTFSGRTVAGLDARLTAAVPRGTRTSDISTFHSFARRLVEAHADARGWSRPPDILTGPDQRGLVAGLLADEDDASWSPAFRSLLGSATFAGEVTDFILRCREQLIDGADLAGLAHDRPAWRGLPAFLARYDADLRRRSAVDYGTLLAEAAALVADPEVSTALVEQYPWILVDEYQDTTHVQLVILQRLAAAGAGVTAAADPYQSIYSFRGSDVGHVARFHADFATAAAPDAEIVLPTSFRTPGDILAAAVRVTGRLLPGSAGKVTPAPGNGSVEVYRFEQHVEEAEWIADEIQRLHLEDGVPYEGIGIFVRSDAGFLAPLSRSLERRQIPHDRPDSRLVDQAPTRFVLDLVAASTGMDGSRAADAALRRVLLGPMYRIPVAQMSEIERRRGDRSWAATLRGAFDGAERLADLLADPSWANRSPAAAGLWKVWSTLPPIRAVVADPRRAPEVAMWSSFAQVVARWGERHPTGTLVTYRRHVESDDFEATPLHAHQPDPEHRVRITTLHQAKGLAFEVVFIANAVEGVFPDLRARDSLLGARHLQPHLPADTAGYVQFRLDEERRLAYTAMTRASHRVVWTTTDGGSGVGGEPPSRFLALAAGVSSAEAAFGEPVRPTPPVTTAQMEASLRRAAADPAAPPGRRLAAVEVLARGEEAGLRSPERFSAVAARGPDTGVVGGALQLSPSQAEAYEVCPRRYVLERRLGVGDEPTGHMEFGSLIHGILEEVETAAMRRGDLHGTADEALERLASDFPIGGFGGGAFDEAWRRRARAALTNLYGGWPSAGMPLASEQRLTITRGPVTWIGRADRLEDRGGRIAVVDYKTSATLPSRDDAASSLQLGFYTIAVDETPELTSVGPVAAAEMWFPMVPQTAAIATRSFDLGNLADIEERMATVATGVASEDWTPTPGPHCDRCPVRSVCPALPEGEEAFAS